MYERVLGARVTKYRFEQRGTCRFFLRRSGRGGVGGPSRVGLHACTRHWGGRYDTADWLGTRLQMDRVPRVGLTKEFSAGGYANHRDASYAWFLLPCGRRGDETYRPFIFGAGTRVTRCRDGTMHGTRGDTPSAFSVRSSRRLRAAPFFLPLTTLTSHARVTDDRRPFPSLTAITVLLEILGLAVHSPVYPRARSRVESSITSRGHALFVRVRERATHDFHSLSYVWHPHVRRRAIDSAIRKSRGHGSI